MIEHKVKILRYSVQAASLLSFSLLLASLSYPLGLKGTIHQMFIRLDPWQLFSWLRWQQEIPPWFWLSAIIIISTLLWGRVFCGWLCPLGALLTVANTLSRQLFHGKRLSQIRKNAFLSLRPFRYYWLLVISIIFLLGSNILLFFTPFAIFSHELMRILAGFVPWLLILLISCTIIFSRLWCSAICPTGMLLAFIAQKRLFSYKTAANCVHCGKCIEVCPAGARDQTSLPKEWCLACGNCQESCKTNHIRWENTIHKPDNQATAQKISRRYFFKLTACTAAALALWQTTISAASKVIRPPGALPEAEFVARCNRCGKCIQVCPSKALWPMDITTGLENFETPHIVPRKARCDLCFVCQEVCPTGAIAKVSLGKVNMGKATLDQSRCLAWQEHKLCFVCGEQCPVGALKGDTLHRPSVLLDKCVGCGACENACPVSGAAAISIN
jgi:ferredoxin-type protein NapH